MENGENKEQKTRELQAALQENNRGGSVFRKEKQRRRICKKNLRDNGNKREKNRKKK